MAELFGQIKQAGNMLGKGLLSQSAPMIAQGFVAQSIQKVTVKQVTDLVNKKGDLWDILNSEHRDGIKQLGARAGKVDWLTTEWFLEAIKVDAPAVASLFLGWTKAHHWLDNQIDLLKKELSQ